MRFVIWWKQKENTEPSEMRYSQAKHSLIYGVALTLHSIIYPHIALPQESGESEVGNWLMYFGTEKLSEKLSIHHEGQLRLYETTSNFNQLLLRYGLNYRTSDNSILTGGYGFISSATFDKEDFGIKSNEHRIWEQFILKNKVGRLNFEHRYRLEQRWITSDDISNDYTNRARYRLFISIPLSNKEMIDDTLFFVFYDEIFLNLNNNPYSQNRFYLALGFKFNSTLSLQSGYLRNKIGGNEFNRLQFGAFLNTDF